MTEKICNTTIALSMDTRDLLQKIGYPSERYDDTIRRISAHYEKCPFAKIQTSAREVLQKISDSDGLSWASPRKEEKPEEYAERILNRMRDLSFLEFNDIKKHPGEDDPMYLLRVIIAGAKF